MVAMSIILNQILVSDLKPTYCDKCGLWSYKRGGLLLEVNCKSLVHANCGLSIEMVFDGWGLSKEGLLYVLLIFILFIYYF